MPRIRLRIEEEVPLTPCLFTDPGNPAAGIQQFHVLRLATIARIESQHGRAGPVRAVSALIDTGAWISVIETRAWEDYERAGLIEHLPLDGPPTRSAAIGGRATAYQLGRIWVSLHELLFPGRSVSLPAVPVIAQLLLNRECRLSYPIVLGLHLGVLDGRRLTREPRPPLPGPIPSNRSTDCGPWFSQDWFLETV